MAVETEEPKVLPSSWGDSIKNFMSEVPVIDQAFIYGDGTIVSADEVAKSVTNGKKLSLVDIAKKKHLEEREIAKSMIDVEITESGYLGMIDPPYPPLVLAAYLQIDEIHWRCVRTKVTDQVGRRYEISPKPTQKGQYEQAEPDDAKKKKITNETKLVRNFIESCNPIDEFEGIIEAACMDYESVGWCGIEAIRSRDKMLSRLNHIPADRIRVRKDWKGFIELKSGNDHTYFQNFGEKVLSTRKDYLGQSDRYDPIKDGPIEKNRRLQWNLIDRQTGEKTTNLDKAANELIFIRKIHPATVYYGLPDTVPAAGHIESNINIRDFFLQFFEHNAVPQYAVIVKGAKMAQPVKELIMKFFKEEVKGRAHQTLIIPVPSAGGEVEVIFEKLSADEREGSFQETRKNNRDAIMAAHGVSPAIIGIAEHSELGSGKGLSQAEIYKDRIVTPGQWRWGRMLTKMFKYGLGVTDICLEFDPLDIRDEKAQAETGRIRITSGQSSINQERQWSGFGDPIPGGDRPFIVLQGGQIVFIEDLVKDGKMDQNAQNVVDQLGSDLFPTEEQ